MKVTIDGERLKQLGLHSMTVGTQDNWIRMAIEWITSAEKRIDELNEKVCQCNSNAFKKDVLGKNK